MVFHFNIFILSDFLASFLFFNLCSWDKSSKAFIIHFWFLLSLLLMQFIWLWFFFVDNFNVLMKINVLNRLLCLYSNNWSWWNKLLLLWPFPCPSIGPRFPNIVYVKNIIFSVVSVIILILFVVLFLILCIIVLISRIIIVSLFFRFIILVLIIKLKRVVFSIVLLVNLIILYEILTLESHEPKLLYLFIFCI